MIRPRAEHQRGDDKNRSTGFYAHLGRKPAGLPYPVPPVSNSNDAQQAKAQDRAGQSFRAAAREVATDDHGDDAGLAALLAGIAQQVQAEAGMERAGIMGSFAAKVLYARKTMTGPQLAAMLQALKRERAAALQSLAQRTAMELKGRLAAARQARFRPSPKP